MTLKEFFLEFDEVIHNSKVLAVIVNQWKTGWGSGSLSGEFGKWGGEAALGEVIRWAPWCWRLTHQSPGLPWTPAWRPCAWPGTQDVGGAHKRRADSWISGLGYRNNSSYFFIPSLSPFCLYSLWFLLGSWPFALEAAVLWFRTKPCRVAALGSVLAPSVTSSSVTSGRVFNPSELQLPALGNGYIMRQNTKRQLYKPI